MPGHWGPCIIDASVHFSQEESTCPGFRAYFQFSKAAMTLHAHSATARRIAA